jgi:hypothetical protein
MRIDIRGEGVAALTCGYLLQMAGCDTAIQRSTRPLLPALMVSASSQALFCDILNAADALSNLPRIETRVVKWGPSATTIALPHSAVVVSEELLQSRIAKLVRFDCGSDDSPDWAIISSRPLPDLPMEHTFGQRMATVVPVKLQSRSAPSTCWIESVKEGWLFLLPEGSGAGAKRERGSAQPQGWLMSVGGSVDSQLSVSEVVAAQITNLSDSTREFPAHPRVAWPLTGSHWLACGTAALAFDPLCGDGTGHAIREAILAAAVLRAIQRGANEDELLNHYQARLVAGFKRHLSVCSEFYESGGTGPWWQAAAEAIREGLVWCDHQLNSAGEFRYRLHGFDLERIS